MENGLKKIIYIITFVTLLSPFVMSDSMTALAVDGGYSSNLFNDSFAISDSYTTLSSDLLIYPNEMFELNLFGDLTLYSQTTGLTNLLGGASFTYIPTDETMKSQLYFNSTVSFVRYGTEFNLYNNAVISGSGSWNYQLSKKVLSKIGVGASSKKYTSTSSVTDKLYYLFGGLNLTLFSKITLYVEGAYYGKEFTTDDLFDSNNSYVDYVARLSRPLGNSLGLNVSYLKRTMDSNDETYMPGFTIDYLSPWATLWGGEEVRFSLKKILPNEFVMTLGASYSEKSYIDQLETDLIDETLTSIYSRDDEISSYFIQIERKIYNESSLIIPRFSIGYLDNSSSIDLYNYDKITFYGSLSLNF